MMEPLELATDRVIPVEFLSVSYTRNLVAFEEGGERVELDGVAAARQRASAVELRLDVANCPIWSADEKARILACRALGADRRGVVRVACGELESRPKNLAAARERLVTTLLEALATPLEPELPERSKRGRGGLFKKKV